MFISLESTKQLNRWFDDSPKVNVIPDRGHGIAREVFEDLAAIVSDYLGNIG